jgi:hypothetical protein
MRIIIETDGMPLAPGDSVNQRTGPATAAEEASIDAGGAPGSSGGSIGDEAGVVTDSGAPPDWLLEAIAAVESQGRRDGQSEEVDEAIADAGSGPDA